MRSAISFAASLLFVLGGIVVVLWLAVATAYLFVPRRRPGRLVRRIPFVQTKANQTSEARILEAKTNLAALGVPPPAESLWPRAALQRRYYAHIGFNASHVWPVTLVWVLVAAVPLLIFTGHGRLRPQLTALAGLLALLSLVSALLRIDRAGGQRGQSEDVCYEAVVDVLVALEPGAGPPSTAVIGDVNEKLDALTSALVQHAYFTCRAREPRRSAYIDEAARASQAVGHAVDDVRRGSGTLTTVAGEALALLTRLGQGLPLNLAPASSPPLSHPAPRPWVPSRTGLAAYVAVVIAAGVAIAVLASSDIDSHIADIVTAIVVFVLSLPAANAARQSAANTAGPPAP